MFSISMRPDAARAERRHRDHVVAAVGAGHRHALLRLVVLQVLARDEAAVRHHLLLDEPAPSRPRRSPAGPCAAMRSSVRARSGCFSVSPGLVRHAVLRELRDRRRVAPASSGSAVAQRPREAVGHQEAVARQRDGRLDQPPPRQLAVLLPRQVQAGHRPGHADRQVAVVVQRPRCTCPSFRNIVGDRLAPAPSRGSRRRPGRPWPGG